VRDIAAPFRSQHRRSNRVAKLGSIRQRLGASSKHALKAICIVFLVRLVPQWYSDGGPISIYYASRALLPAKTRVFVDFVVQAFKRDRLAELCR
jgi:hypothetical protein